MTQPTTTPSTDPHADADWATAPFDGARRSQKVSEIVAARIIEELVASGLGPGDRLPLEAAMVERYQVSRASLREALRLLEVQGLIVLRPGRGGGPIVGTVRPEFVARTTTLYLGLERTSFDDLFSAHLLMEMETAGNAAAHPDRELVERSLDPFLRPSPPSDDDVTRHERYRTFHQTIRTLGRNRVFNLLGNSISHVVSTHVHASMEPVELQARIDEEHRELSRLIIAGDVRRARLLTRDHFQAILDHLRDHWPHRLARPVEWR